MPEAAIESLLPNLPPSRPSQTGITPQQMVAQEFSMVYTPAAVAAVNMIADTTALEPLVAEWNTVRD
jgi:hypothetical protein